MKDTILSLVTGGVVGLIFGLLKLPIPAPSAIAGLAGIAGIFLGFALAGRF